VLKLLKNITFSIRSLLYVLRHFLNIAEQQNVKLIDNLIFPQTNNIQQTGLRSLYWYRHNVFFNWQKNDSIKTTKTVTEPITTKVVISNPAHGEVYSIEHRT